MSLMKKCDRCGNVYDPYNEKSNSKQINGFLFLNIDLQQKYFSHKPNDLCPKCAAMLTKWFTEKEDFNA